jgi:hypothetical protein
MKLTFHQHGQNVRLILLYFDDDILFPSHNAIESFSISNITASETDKAINYFYNRTLIDYAQNSAVKEMLFGCRVPKLFVDQGELF